MPVVDSMSMSSRVRAKRSMAVATLLRRATQPRPLLQQAERGCVIQIVPAFFAGQLVNLVHGFQSGQLDAMFLRHIKHEVDVFVHQAQWKVWSVIVTQDKRSFVIDSAGA